MSRFQLTSTVAPNVRHLALALPDIFALYLHTQAQVSFQLYATMTANLLHALLFLIAVFEPYGHAADPPRYGQAQIALGDDSTQYEEACPEYTQYSAYPQ